MGIPHLTATLEPYAVHRLLQDEPVVIDGPALAYHMLNMCRVNGISRPSYRLVGQSTVAWLDALASRQVVVQAVYFDGHLPTSKLEVRMERLVKSTAQLSRLFSDNPHGCPTSQLALDGREITVDVFKAGIPRSRPFVDPSFLVPAVIDTLRQHPRYQDLALLVPGEADAYCARHVLELGGVALTSDSDLLAYMLGDGQVVFFRDLHRDAASAIRCSSFAPKLICQRLGLPSSEGPLRLAYERKRAPRAKLPQVVRACSQPVMDQQDYGEFCHQYLCLDGDVSMLDDRRLPQLGGLDLRISELVTQLRDDRTGDARVFLPVLTENLARGSAWEQSTCVRRLAYTLLRWAALEASMPILEYRLAQSPTQKGRAIEALSAEEARLLGDEILNLVEWAKRITRGSERPFWPLVCLAIDVCECQKQNKPSHAWNILQHRHGPSIAKAGKINWDLVHFLAQLQAAFYSLRVLRQALSIYQGSPRALALPNAELLRTALLDFPPLTDSPDFDSTMELLMSSEQNGLAQALGGLLGMPMAPAPNHCGGSKARGNARKKRAAEKRGNQASHKPAVKSKDLRPANRFGLLSAD